MKSVFIGSVKFSEQALNKLIELEVEIVGVVTKDGSSFNSDFVDLSSIASEHDLPYLHTNDINSSEVYSWIKEKQPDIIFCFGWSQLLGKEVLKTPPMGIVGYHPAKIPENRGRHPLIWAIALGLEETASTFFLMDEGADTGDIISQKSFRIDFEDYAKDVYERMTKTALSQIEEFVPQLYSGSFEKVPQRLNSGNSWRKRGKEDGRIDFRMSTEAIYNLVRALSKPYAGAHINYNYKEIKIWRVTPSPNEYRQNLEPGKVLNITEGGIITVKTQDTAIDLLEHDFYNYPDINSYLK